MVKRLMVIGLAITMGLAVGCSRMSEVQKWAAGGAVVGGAAGAAYGDLGGHGLNTVHSGLVGAAAGGLVGALIGDGMEDKACTDEFFAALSKKDADLEMWQEKERQATAKMAGLMQDLAARDREIARLKDRLANCQGVRTEMTFAADVLFKSGSAELSDAGKKALDEAAQKVKSSGKKTVVEGHTDTDPIKAAPFKSNWELGSARALMVLHYLVSKGVDPAKLSAATYGQYSPVGGDKAKNRRAVIALYN
jgi:flagellar motor protein MotB